MADFMMVMMGTASVGDWETYIGTLIESGKFRGGSSLGRGVSVCKDKIDGECTITGYIRFVAEDLEEAKLLLAGNPLYEAGGCVELLEEIPD
jgi:hypothetical protein